MSDQGPARAQYLSAGKKNDCRSAGKGARAVAPAMALNRVSAEGSASLANATLMPRANAEAASIMTFMDLAA